MKFKNIPLQIAFYLWLKCQVTVHTASADNLLVHSISSFNLCGVVHSRAMQPEYYYIIILLNHLIAVQNKLN